MYQTYDEFFRQVEQRILATSPVAMDEPAVLNRMMEILYPPNSYHHFMLHGAEFDDVVEAAVNDCTANLSVNTIAGLLRSH
jgi:hypothetical protein